MSQKSQFLQFFSAKIFLKSKHQNEISFVDFFIVNFEFEIQGCEMICSQTQNPNLGTFLRALCWKMLTYFLAIRNIFWRFGIFKDHSVQFAFIWYIHFSGFGIMHQEKSGSPGLNTG
jgi:hypothetical protein